MTDAGANEDTARICMLIIGIGYLFPIAAIWAAFDYWKVLFPDSNIEFLVTSLYQVGSVITVAALSLSESFSLGRRIIGGFTGQFVSLAVILSFRWLPVPRNTLYELLLSVVFLCSIATGYLDSALLALCSQYSTKMQQYLQIGIGFGTLVSVFYRDATKALMSHDIEDATAAYFVVALVTVLICLGAYRLLMSLPVSQGIGSEMLDEKLLDHTDDFPLLSPNSAAYGVNRSPGNEHGRARPALAKMASPSVDEECATLDAASQASSFTAVLKLVWRNQLVILLNFFLTTLCYPGIITAIPCRQMLQLRAGHWFQTLLLTAFTLIDIIGRFMTHVRFGLHYGNVQLTVVVRAIVFPVMLFCATSDSATDVLSIAVVGCFGFLNGYCASLGLIVVNEIPHLTNEQRKTCGRISACSVNGGLALGSLAASAVATSMGLTS
eukprot:CAMPEP_0197632294 /NCGR_PEP_ID=MMETSP1338-20131121/9112_1 /TAXON_ID=43686 ORGANISM="Pelagodinium beii, Strain RCC1491" /NCGR_SAMPLE_ID=MMETSP1338 /ASSEMBLY_ACC=CAM_ASM_000754 /LENGTH=437 /DNA_ID=CAMNT_0043203853 /DNA_START=34 /DNA_END=1347 /DNA_ORIENTATION=-